MSSGIDVKPGTNLSSLYCSGWPGTTPATISVSLQGYLAHEKKPCPGTIRQAFGQGPMTVLERGRFLMSEVPLYSTKLSSGVNGPLPTCCGSVKPGDDSKVHEDYVESASALTRQVSRLFRLAGY